MSDKRPLQNISMAFQILFAPFVTFLVVVISIFIMRLFRSSPKSLAQSDPLEPTAISKKLSEALPNSVFLPNDAAAFSQSTGSYWAKQECEVAPACVVRPRNDEEISTAVKILKNGHDESSTKSNSGEANFEHLFAVRSGGHSCVANAATIEGGVLIDLRPFNEVNTFG